MTDFEELYKDCHVAGGMSKYRWYDDPRLMAFYLARYKHTAKLLMGMTNVLEIGCADGFGSRIVAQHVGKLTAVDVDAKSIDEAIKYNQWGKRPINFKVGSSKGHKDYAAVYSLDVFEHINPGDEVQSFLGDLYNTAPVMVLGTPSLESQRYASPLSVEGHVNCMSGPDLRRLLRELWPHVFMFSMNDEALGTGFLPMAHYLLALCVR